MDLRWLLGPIVGILGLWAVLVMLLWAFRPRDVALSELVRIVPDVLRLVRRLIGDSTVPFGPRVALVFLLAWLVSPIDLIPEFIPVLGALDDAVVAVLVLRYVRGRVGSAELRARWPGTLAGFELLDRLLGGSRRTL